MSKKKISYRRGNWFRNEKGTIYIFLKRVKSNSYVVKCVGGTPTMLDLVPTKSLIPLDSLPKDFGDINIKI